MLFSEAKLTIRQCWLHWLFSTLKSNVFIDNINLNYLYELSEIQIKWASVHEHGNPFSAGDLALIDPGPRPEMQTLKNYFNFSVKNTEMLLT